MLVDCRLMYTELGGQQSGVCRTRANLLRRLRSPQPGDEQKAGGSTQSACPQGN
jgi:hypothetical protein